jgi:hypothetical protein
MKVEIGGVYDLKRREWVPNMKIMEEKISGGWSISIEDNGIQRVEVRGSDKGSAILNCLMKLEEL